MNVVLFILNQLFMSSHFSNFMVGMIVLMTPGRSRASAYLQMKYIHNKLAKDNESVLLLAACRDEDSEEIVNQTFAYFEDGNVNLEIISKSDNWLNEIIARIHSEADKNSNPNVEIFFAGGEKLIYLKAYQTLSLDKNYTNVLSITEPDMATAVEFTIDDWLVANKSKEIKYDSNRNILKISNIELAQPRFKLGLNPTRLFCKYVISYSYKAEFSSESAKIENVKIRKSLEQINVLLNELNLVNDIRMELSVEINDLDKSIYTVYYDKRFLSRNGFIFLMLDPNIKTEFYISPDKFDSKSQVLIQKRFEILKQKLHNYTIKSCEKQEIIDKWFTNVATTNMSRIDSMKWLTGLYSKPKYDYDRKYLIEGFNGRELSEIMKSCDLSKSQFTTIKKEINYDMKKLTIISGLIIGFNSHHYLELSENQFEKFVEDIVQIKLFKKADASNKNLLQKTDFIVIRKLKFNNNIPHIEFELSNHDQTLSMKADLFSEMLHSLAKHKQRNSATIYLFENWWIFNRGKGEVVGRPLSLLERLGIKKSKKHVVNPDGYSLHRTSDSLEFEVFDVNILKSINDERVIEKYLKYEKTSSKFPFPIYTSVFSIFTGVKTGSEKESDSLGKIKTFISESKYRTWKYLDITEFIPETVAQHVKIDIELLGRFLADRETGIHGFAEWCKSKSEVGLEILEEE